MFDEDWDEMNPLQSRKPSSVYFQQCDDRYWRFNRSDIAENYINNSKDLDECDHCDVSFSAFGG